METKKLDERKKQIEEELKEIEAEQKKAQEELAKAEEKKVVKEQERKQQEEKRKQQVRERPKDWDKYVHISARKQQVEDNGRKRIQFVTGLGSYARDIKLAISKYGEAITLARGIAISRAVDLSQHRFLEEDDIVIKDIKIDKEDIEREGRKRRVAEIKIVLGKAGG